MSSYDANILQKYADELYSRADAMAIWGGFKGALLGLVFFFIYLTAMDALHGQSAATPSEVMALIFVGLGAFIGYRLGNSKGFMLRLQAQTALCQMQTEYNTRSGK